MIATCHVAAAAAIWRAVPHCDVSAVSRRKRCSAGPLSQGQIVCQVTAGTLANVMRIC